MLLLDLRNRFILEYKLECQKKNVKEIGLATQDKIIAAWIASGEQDICDRLSLLTTYTDIAYVPVTDFTTYSLPTNFGKLLKTEPELKTVDITDIKTVNNGNPIPQGEIHTIAIYNDGTAFKAALMDLPASSGSVRVWYSINTLMYSPGGTTSQNWGSFDGLTFTGNLKIPEKYTDLLLLYILGKIFDDRKLEYEANLLRLRGNSSTTHKDTVEYDWSIPVE